MGGAANFVELWEAQLLVSDPIDRMIQRLLIPNTN